jgi:hypothetical protein
MRELRSGRAGVRRGATALIAALAGFLAAACTGSDAVLVTNSLLAANTTLHPPIMRAVDGIPGWKRSGDPERFNKDGLYGYIDGGAEIVLQYGFRELSVFKFTPAEETAAEKELVLEIYLMNSAQAAFGFYSTKLEGEEQGWPGIKSDHWISLGQANLVKDEFMINILAPECTDREIGEFMVALERKIPGRGTARPKGMRWLPREGMVPVSGRYIKGPLAAQSESPFLEQAFWGFGAAEGATEAYSAKYGAAPAVSKLVIVKFKKAPAAGVLEDSVLAAFSEYLVDALRDGDSVEGKNQAGRWFLFKGKGAVAALVLGDPDRDAARARLDAALALASR